MYMANNEQNPGNKENVADDMQSIINMNSAKHPFLVCVKYIIPMQINWTHNNWACALAFKFVLLKNCRRSEASTKDECSVNTNN
jgi:hypothetical protein